MTNACKTPEAVMQTLITALAAGGLRYGVPCSFWRAFKAAVNARGRKLSISLKRAANLSAPPLGR